jgi:hypothetical protein
VARRVGCLGLGVVAVMIVPAAVVVFFLSFVAAAESGM